MTFKEFIGSIKNKDTILKKYKEMLDRYGSFIDEEYISYNSKENYDYYQKEKLEIFHILKSLETMMKNKNIEYKHLWKELDYSYGGIR